MFLQEEIALMSGYDGTSLEELLKGLREALPHMESLEAADLAYSSLVKLQAMTAEEFAELQEELRVPELF